MAGDLNAKHLDWNSRLFTTRGRPHIVQVKKLPNDWFCLALSTAEAVCPSGTQF
jgi:hypothetical protein